MRLRNDKNAINILKDNPDYFIFEPNKDTIEKFISQNKKFEIEIGMGKGQFIINKSLTNHDSNFLGIERNMVICSKAIKKVLKQETKINNLKIINFDAIKLLELIPNNSVDKIYLNFSDPWPKKRHAKNRLTNIKFLNIYKELLKDNGVIEFKSDNDSLFEYTKEVLEENSNIIDVVYITTDLYADIDNEFNKGNIATEYEQRFNSLNKNIYKIIFKFK